MEVASFPGPRSFLSLEGINEAIREVQQLPFPVGIELAKCSALLYVNTGEQTLAGAIARVASC